MAPSEENIKMLGQRWLKEEELQFGDNEKKILEQIGLGNEKDMKTIRQELEKINYGVF